MQQESVKRRLRIAAVSILTRPEGRVQLVRVLVEGAAEVSILTRPEGRVQLRIPQRRRHIPTGVSILTRPEGRVQPLRRARRWSWHEFQSSPVPKDGCNFSETILPILLTGFNPHPSRRTGAT